MNDDIIMPIKFKTNTFHVIFDAINIDKFLSEEFGKVNKDVDFFLETSPYDIPNYAQSSNRNKYISDLRNFFGRNFTIEQNKFVKKSKKYPNVRFHYADIRLDYGILDNYINAIFNYNDIISDINLDFILNGKTAFNFQYNLLSNIVNQGIVLYNITEEVLKNFDKIYYFNKIKNKITNKILKKILKKYLDKIKKNMIDMNNKLKNNVKIFIDIFEYYNKTEKINNKQLLEKTIKPILEYIDEFSSKGMYQVCNIMDIYLLRRFLDKDYITNGILYSGMAHTANITNILITEFNFTITHISSEHNINELNKDIRTKKYHYDRELLPKLLNYNIMDKKIQCSNIKNFPNNFS